MDGEIKRQPRTAVVPDVYLRDHVSDKKQLHLYRRSLCDCESCAANRRLGFEDYTYSGVFEKGVDIEFLP